MGYTVLSPSQCNTTSCWSLKGLGLIEPGCSGPFCYPDKYTSQNLLLCLLRGTNVYITQMKCKNTIRSSHLNILGVEKKKKKGLCSGPLKKSFWSSVGFKIGAVTFFLPAGKYVDTLYTQGPNFLKTKYMYGG